MTETAKPIAQIHHVSGCSDSFVIDYFLINALGVVISKPHSLAGYPAIPQINQSYRHALLPPDLKHQCPEIRLRYERTA
jgi:hypothetical protein